MTHRRTTLKDIATTLGLSLPTVSRALADHPDISEETKARVRATAAALHYVPNMRARSLRSRHSRLIALIIPEMNMFFVPALIAGITKVVQAHDYSLIVFQSDNQLAQERRLVEYCTQLSVDGVLLACSSETEHLEHLAGLRDCDIPVVLLDKTLDTATHTTVRIDDFETAREAGRYLLGLGHERVLGLFGDQRQRICAQRLRGFRRAFADAGVPLEESQLLRAADPLAADDLLDRAFAAHPGTTAVFTMSDELLVRAHHQCMRTGRRIPDDVSLLAISDGSAPAFLWPAITHFRHSGHEVGERTAHILIGLIDHRSDAMLDVRIRTTLVELDSVAPLVSPARPAR